MLAICTDTLKGYGLNRVFELVKKAGFDGIDLNIDPRNFDTANIEYVKSLIESYQLPVLAISLPITSSPNRLLDAVDMAREIGCRIVVVQPPKIFDFKFVQWLKTEIPKIRQKENISIALENAPSDTFIGIIPEHAMNNLVELKKFKHVCIDTTRIASKKEDLIRIYKILKPYLVHVHLSNVKQGESYFLPQEGILPIESFLTKLKQDGFPGTISMKINPRFLDGGNDLKLLEHLKSLKKFYETYFAEIETVNDQDHHHAKVTNA